MKKDPHRKNYEASDIKTKPIFLFGFWLSVFTLLISGLLFWMLKQMEVRAARMDRAPFFMRSENFDQAAPRLEVHPSRTYQEYQNEMRRLTSSYGWVDFKRKIVRTPLSYAMQQVLHKGLPFSNTTVEH